MTKEKDTAAAAKLEKLRKLLALAAAQSGATEAEALGALAKAQEYATTHGLSIEEANSKTFKASDHYSASGPLFSSTHHADYYRSLCPADAYLWMAIRKFCGVYVRLTKDSDGDNAIEYFGHEADVELAMFLRLTMNKAMFAGWGALQYTLPSDARPDWATTAAERKRTEAKQYEMRHAFFLGFADTVRTRMQWLIDTRNEHVSPSVGTALVAIKDSLIKAEAAKIGFYDAIGVHGKHRPVDSETYGAGKQHGHSVDLGRGVGGGNKTLAIGR